MKQAAHQGGIFIVLSFVLAFMLTIVPLPDWAEQIRPHWVMLTVVYWCMALPHRVSIGIAWTAGLFLDVLLDALLGQHAVALALVAFLTVRLHQRLRIFPLWQQSIVIFSLCFVNSMIILWIKGISGIAPDLWRFILPCVSSALLWPGVFIVLRQVRRAYRVN